MHVCRERAVNVETGRRTAMSTCRTVYIGECDASTADLSCAAVKLNIASCAEAVCVGLCRPPHWKVSTVPKHAQKSVGWSDRMW